MSKSGMIFYRSTRECRRGHKRYKASRIRRETCSRKLLPLRKRCGRSERKSIKERRVHELSKKVDSNRMAAAELEDELRGLQAGEERRGSNASQVNECCLDTVAEQLFTMGAAQAKHQARSSVQRNSSEDSRPQLLLRKCQEEKREENEEEQEQRKASQQMGPPAPGGCNEGFQRVLFLILLGFGVQW